MELIEPHKGLGKRRRYRMRLVPVWSLELSSIAASTRRSRSPDHQERPEDNGLTAKTSSFA
jgi:hypothetical protein